MDAITLVDNEYVTLQYWPDKKIVYHTIHRHVDEKLFKAALETGAEALKKHGACKWLSDDRKNGPLSQAFINWDNTDWQPRTIAAGWKYWANVVPEDLEAAGTLLPSQQD